MSDDPNHKNLLSHLKIGDEAAFTSIYNLYHKGIYTYLLSFVKIPQKAEDLVHEVFIKVWEKRESLIITKSLTSYLYRIAHNIAIDSLKKISKDEILVKEIIQFTDSSRFLMETENKKSSFYENLYLEAVSALTPQRQKVFILCREKGQTYDETATSLGISRNTVKEHMAKSLSFLKTFLYEKGALLLFPLNFLEF